MHPQRFPLTQKAKLVDPKGRVLLLRDAATGTWDLPGGRLDPGELYDLGAALRRELDEEIAGVAVTLRDAPEALLPHTMADGSEALMLLWQGRAEGLPTLSPEHNAWTWWTRESLVAPEAPALRAALGLMNATPWHYGISGTRGAIGRT
jgi:ADP-ribose pyrophosphatase YjhB (NUDIX family)